MNVSRLILLATSASNKERNKEVSKYVRTYVRTWLIGILRHKGSRTNNQNTAPLLAVVIKVLLHPYIASPLRGCYFIMLACLFVCLSLLSCLLIYLFICLFVFLRY